MSIENLKLTPDTITDRNIFIVVTDPGSKNFTVAAFANRRLVMVHLQNLPGMKAIRSARGITELRTYTQLRNALAEKNSCLIELLDAKPGARISTLEIIKAPLIRR
jgi:hypothetical protein